MKAYGARTLFLKNDLRGFLMGEQSKYRLITRSDFDGLVCAMLLREKELIDDILFVHPKDMQDGKIPVSDRDITTNLPYVPGVHLAFDHHHSEAVRMENRPENHILVADAPSASRVVYDYYGGAETFHNVDPELMAAVDQADTAQFTDEEIFEPTGWALMNFIMDPRTGLGRFKEFTVSNYDLMMELIDYCRNHSVEEVLALPHVKERVDLYFEQEYYFKTQIQARGEVHDNLIVLDFRNEEVLYAGNRFMVYALFPQCNISMHIHWGKDRQNIEFAIGKSIFDRSSKTNVGELCLQFGGGGHEAAGTCQVDVFDAHKVKKS
nr:exopolyphosphatase [Magnetofaba australis]